MRIFLLAFGLAALAWALTQPEPGATRLTGQVSHVVDGDTFDIGGTRIRVFGIDAPEAATPMGPKATGWMRAKLGGRTVDCVKKDTDRYGRTVATCYLDGADVALAMVRDGWARAYRRYSLDYVAAEDAAKARKLGIWSGTLQTASEAVGACNIKGNISSNGRIYHVPGTRDYDMTKIDTSKGERWFCSEDEAREAGWRPVGGRWQ